MSRGPGVLLTLALLAVVAPLRTSAQTDFGKGERADEAIRDAVVEFAEGYVDLFNAGDAAAVDLVNPEYWLATFFSDVYEDAVAYVQSNAFPVELYAVRDVRVHETGHVSAELTYSGWITPATFYTDRWYFLPLDGGGYMVDELASRPPRIPDGLEAGELGLTLTDEGPEFSASELPAADVLVLNVKYTGADDLVTGGLYVLPEGMSAEEANAALVADFAALEYLGPTPARPETEYTYAFLIEPGTTYVLQQFSQNAAGTNPQVLEGAAFAVGIVIGDSAS